MINRDCTFNALFDVMNSRNPCSYGWKRHLQVDNNNEVMKFIADVQQYLVPITLPLPLPLFNPEEKQDLLDFLHATKVLK